MQGFNMGRYVPPESEGIYSANQVSGKHALGARARKAGQGILTVRFEMPFAVWCSTCPKPTIIGQGVRFNAEKKKVGNYHSTTIWAFRMKHVACGGWIEIHTDPKNTDYVVIEGGKRRDTGEDKVREGDFEIKTESERLRLQEDAFAALEVKIGDRKQADTDKARIEELYTAKERDWDDPYSVNKRLRKTFRTERKELEKKAVATEELKSRMSLAIDVVEETEEDQRRATLIDFGKDVATESTASGQPLFKHGLPGQPLDKLSSGNSARQNLQRMLSQNTRSTLDVFSTTKKSTGSGMIPGVKRKRDDTLLTAATEFQGGDSRGQSPLLVTYDSE